MRTLGGFAVGLLISGCAFAQMHGVAGGHGPSGAGRTGVVLPFPTAGTQSASRPPSGRNPARNFTHTAPAVGYYPIYVGGYGYGYGYDPGYYGGGYNGYYDNSYTSYYGQPGYGQPAAQQQPNVVVVYPQMPPQMMVSQGPPPDGAMAQGPPVQSQSSEPPSTLEPPHYLIAFKDHTIYTAVAYWVDGDTLHYFTDGNTHNQVSLSLIDRDLTMRLNHEAGIDLKLPN
jgi:hypothetical protein